VKDSRCVIFFSAPIHEHSHYEKNSNINQELRSLDWFQDFTRFVHNKGLRARSVRSYLGWVQQLANHYPQDEIPTLESRDVLDFLVHLQIDRGLAGSTVNQAVCALRCLYQEHLEIQWNIWKKIKIVRDETLPVILSREEVYLFLTSFRDARYHAFFSTIYLCGLRLSEAINLKPSDIHSSRMVIRIRKGKGGKQREVPLSNQLLLRLRLFWKSHRNPQWLFPAPGRRWKSSEFTLQQALHQGQKPMSKAAAWAAFNLAKAQCGLADKHPELRPHTLRHCYATHLLDAGVSLKQVSPLLGHASLTPTLVYLHLTEESETKARAAIEELKVPQQKSLDSFSPSKLS